MSWQNTHWYWAIGKGGYTSNPFYAAEGEIERVGLHSCEQQKCEESHTGTAKDYYERAILAAEVARQTEGDAGT